MTTSVHHRPRGERARLAVVGVGGRGAANLDAVAHEELVALCDVDSEHLDQAVARLGERPEGAFRGRKYSDFRQMLEQESGLDGVVVSTPDHTHAVVAAAALRRGLAVYCEKPLAHSVAEVRELQRLAAARGVATQMGTQIHAGENYRRVVERVRSGVLGTVREVHVWVGKTWSDGRLGWPQRVPAALDWDLWQGPVPARRYRRGLHPAGWRRFWDYGTGTLGDMGCHYLDLPHWALELGTPRRVRAEGPPVHPVGTPRSLHAVWQHSARGARPAVEVHWTDGGLRPPDLPTRTSPDGTTQEWGDGVLFVGERGRLIANYDVHELLLDDGSTPPPPDPWIPPSIGHHHEWLAALRDGRPTTCAFATAGDLSTTVLLGNVAYRAGGEVTWDENAGTTVERHAQAFVADERRAGW